MANKRKIALILLNIFFVMFFCLPILVSNADTYKLLEPSVLIQPGADANSISLQVYLENAYYVFLVVIVVSAVVMFVWGGLIYITTDLPGQKSNGRQKIENALIGLFIAAVSYLILYTINPALLWDPTKNSVLNGLINK